MCWCRSGICKKNRSQFNEDLIDVDFPFRLKQVDDQAEKRERDMYEMSKPLARYANDADLDKALREVEREGDTMLAEIKQRRIKEGKSEPGKLNFVWTINIKSEIFSTKSVRPEWKKKLITLLHFLRMGWNF